MTNDMWLALDTATEYASVAVGTAERVVLARMVGARQHAAQILLVIDHVLQTAGIQLEDVAGIVVGDGPGSFTGLRIGWAAAKGLAHERDLPLVAIPSLLGAAAASGETTGSVAACYDALRGQVFGAIYSVRPGRVETIVAPDLYTVSELASRAPVRPVLAVGDGIEKYQAELTRWIGRAAVPLSDLAPIAGTLLALASMEGARRLLDDPARAEPIYGRPAEAQAKWEARYGRPLPHSSR
ncbi:MAG: tRNA (adenosine(37)-N6)-threonylcarbamoyltransferase complex dimerization subunit type 1 TsaB [Gemmatimonadales bacterium]